ncbi:toprim domain-containing protein, partial [Candidatus Saccharibacteria bacterium]|nr:toprim domain-containing protein [Candidatus Saccharibacteria bacterium]
YEYALCARQLSKETVLAWRLGYSPNNGTALIDFLRTKGFKDTELKLAGLTSNAYRGGLQDMFRGRLMIPLCDPQGRVIGFTARQLDDEPNAPKYINTPSTPLYDKSRHIFGLHFAKEAIRKKAYAVLAEGNLDVISSHQANVRQVVATAGTALTEPHLKALSRLTGDIRLCFDADKAGVAATERAIPVASKVGGVQLSIVTIPNGKDPDELIRQDTKLWAETIENPHYIVDWLIDRYTERLDLTTAIGKRQLSDVVLKVVRQLPDRVEQDHYLGRLADLLQVSTEALRAKLSEVSTETSPVRRRVAVDTQVQQSAGERDAKRTEENLMALTLMQPSLREYLYTLKPDMFGDTTAKELFVFISEHPEFDGKDSAQVKKIAEHGKIASLIYETLYQDVEVAELRAEAKRLRSKLISQYVRSQKQTIVENLKTAETNEAEKLLKRAKDLDTLLHIDQGDADGTKER